MINWDTFSKEKKIKSIQLQILVQLRLNDDRSGKIIRTHFHRESYVRHGGYPYVEITS